MELRWAISASCWRMQTAEGVALAGKQSAADEHWCFVRPLTLCVHAGRSEDCRLQQHQTQDMTDITVSCTGMTGCSPTNVLFKDKQQFCVFP